MPNSVDSNKINDHVRSRPKPNANPAEVDSEAGPVPKQQ